VKLLVLVSDPHSEIAINGFHGPPSERKGATAPALADHVEFIELQIEILIQSQIRDLGQSSTCIDEHKENGRVSPILKCSPGARR